jgi:hypothetical protein
MHRIVAGLLVIASLGAASAVAQQPRRVTVVTDKGDAVEGVLKGVSETEASVEVAGQTMRFPLGAIRYISFAGKLEGGEHGSAVVTPLAKAVESLRSLRAATEIGLLREQYSQKLLELLPAVNEFANAPGDDWADVRLSMQGASRRYQAPMSSVDSWKYAGDYMLQAARRGDYAAKLANYPNEASHREEPAVQTLELGDPVMGRLGVGDQIMSSKLDRSTEGGFNDVYRFTVTAKSRLEITMTCEPCTSHLTLVLAGRKLEGDYGGGGQSTIRFDAVPNTYEVWAGTEQGEVGEYRLKVAAAK